MNKYVKKGLSLALAVGLIASSFAGCAKIDYVTNGAIQAIYEIKDGSWQETGEEDGATEEGATVIEALTPGTYGGVEFKSEEDVVNYYVECYNNTKAQTANYIDGDGNTVTYYKLLGEEDIKIESVLIEGKSNSLIDELVPTIMGSLFKKSTYGLPPCNNRDPKLDNTSENPTSAGVLDFQKSYFTPDDCQACNVKDNGDGTITLTIQPKPGSMSMRGEDSQGRFFEVLGDIGATVDSISQLSWASGTTEENCLVEYAGGTGTITIDTATKTVTAADYHMAVTVEVNHANVLVIKDKSAVVSISYDMKYPASDEYLMEARQLTRA